MYHVMAILPFDTLWNTSSATLDNYWFTVLDFTDAMQHAIPQAFSRRQYVVFILKGTISQTINITIISRRIVKSPGTDSTN